MRSKIVDFNDPTRFKKNFPKVKLKNIDRLAYKIHTTLQAASACTFYTICVPIADEGIFVRVKGQKSLIKTCLLYNFLLKMY